jgi:DNA-binding CsgD family transcriptional regulator
MLKTPGLSPPKPQRSRLPSGYQPPKQSMSNGAFGGSSTLETVVDPTIVARLVARRRRTDPLGALTEREREVRALIAEGLSNRAIAGRLFVTERTVEAHVKQVFLKLSLNADPRLPPARASRPCVPAPHVLSFHI